MNEQELVRELEARVQQEIDAQARTLEALERQRTALFDGDSAQIEAKSRELETAARAAGICAQRRGELVRALAGKWNVAAGTLTLSSIATRIGGGERLRTQRGELRQLTAKLTRATRGARALASAHQSVLREAIETLLPGPARLDGETSPSGGLIDAKA
jgi:hypothetical protein